MASFPLVTASSSYQLKRLLRRLMPAERQCACAPVTEVSGLGLSPSLQSMKRMCPTSEVSREGGCSFCGMISTVAATGPDICRLMSSSGQPCDVDSCMSIPILQIRKCGPKVTQQASATARLQPKSGLTPSKSCRLS